LHQRRSAEEVVMENITAPGDSLIQNAVVRLREMSPGCLAVVIDNPPINLVSPRVFAGLQSVRTSAGRARAELDDYVYRPGYAPGKAGGWARVRVQSGCGAA
jgi:hypothetical protein